MQSLKYTINENTILVTPTASPMLPEREVVITSASHEQQRTITGRVTGTDGLPLDGVTVAVKGTNTATTTDASGRYQITLPNDGTVLVFSILGYESQGSEIGKSAVVNMVLQRSEEHTSELQYLMRISYAVI